MLCNVSYKSRTFYQVYKTINVCMCVIQKIVLKRQQCSKLIYILKSMTFCLAISLTFSTLIYLLKSTTFSYFFFAFFLFLHDE